MEPNIFIYEPLPPRHIRILEIDFTPHPSNLARFNCVHISLDVLSQGYDAVSYAWGSSEKPHQILVNGQLLKVTQSIHDMFKSKTFARSGIPLWIDAICVNQYDLIEKGLQVQLMGEIYSNAQRTLVWLGPEGEDSALAISFVETIFSALPELETGDFERTLAYAKKYPEEAPEWTSSSRLLNRTWFSRTWVAQEVALATHADIVCGDSIVSWDTLERFISGLDALGYTFMLESAIIKGTCCGGGPAGLSLVRSLIMVRNRILKGGPRPMSWLITKFLRCQTTEPNDKIYGVLGMTTDVLDPVFTPNYEISSHTLFRDVTRFLILQDGSLDVLRSAGLMAHTSQIKAPSWAFKRDIHHGYQARLGIYSVTPTAKSEFSFGNDGNHLILRGFMIDDIFQLGLKQVWIDRGPLGVDETADYWAWYSEAKSMFESTGQNQETLWRTLLANRTTKQDDAVILMPGKIPDQVWSTYHQAFQTIIPIAFQHSLAQAMPIVLSTEGQMAMKFRLQLAATVISKRFCLLRGGGVAIMPGKARPGDRVVAFLGATILFVVRALNLDKEGNQRYHLIGECYVHDRMDGEVMGLGLEEQNIVLV